MSGTISAALAGLLMLGDPGASVVNPADELRPKYHRFDFESPCGPSLFQARFQNEQTGRGRVDYILIDAQPVARAAKMLDRFARGGAVDRIQIIHCGEDPQHPLFWGIMELTKPEGQLAGRQNSLYFHLVRKGKGWKFSVD